MAFYALRMAAAPSSTPVALSRPSAADLTHRQSRSFQKQVLSSWSVSHRCGYTRARSDSWQTGPENSRWLNTDRKVLKALDFEVRCKADSEHEAPKTLSLGRRDAMLTLTAMSIAGIGMSSPGTAEARISKAEMKRKIIEKLRELREKAGLSKKGESDKGKSPSSKKENRLPLEAAPFPLPSPPQSAPRPLVEATFL